MKATRKVRSTKWDYDVIINGGGVVGAALAADLLKNLSGQIKIAVIEPSSVKPLRTTRSLPDARVYALSPRSIQFLEKINAWKYIETRSHRYKSMQIWESSGPGLVKFHSREMEVEELGRIVEDATIQSGIYKAIEESGHSIEFIHSHLIKDIEVAKSDGFSTDPVSLQLVETTKQADKTAETRNVTSRLLVGADGNNSIVRRLSGIPTWGWNYGQEAIVATISIRDILPNDADGPLSPMKNYNNTAWQKYLPTGPLAVLPLWDGYASIVWSLPFIEAKKLKSLSDEEFLQKLNEALRSPPKTDRWSVLEPEDATNLPPFLNAFVQYINKASGGVLPLERVKHEAAAVLDAIMSAGQLGDPFMVPYEIKHICSPRLSFPLSLQQAKHYYSNRTVLIGDAAHSIHPQAGQGLNLGLSDAAKLSDVITNAVSSGEDFGLESVLERYGKDRYRENLVMLSVVDVLNSLFKDRIDFAGGSAAPFSPGEDSILVKGKQLARSLGMLGVHNSGQLKHQMAKFAMGI